MNRQDIIDKFDLKEIHANEELLDGVINLLKTNKSGLLKKIDDLLISTKDLEKRLKELNS
jgi:alanyl-tRNA synthetase